MHLFIPAQDSESELKSELQHGFPGASVNIERPSLLTTAFDIVPGHPLPPLAFCRQLLPDARPVHAESIRDWANQIVDLILSSLPDNQPWHLHVAPEYSRPAVHRIGARAWYSASHHPAGARLHPQPSKTTDRLPGQHRCDLILQAIMEILQKRRRHLLRQLTKDPRPWAETDSLVQVLLTAPETGFISVAPAPMPFQQQHLVWPFPKGNVPIASDPEAPSRAFAKLVEAEVRLGRTIQPGEKCVDLGASPGSWTYVALKRGGQVTAVDRSPLREDLMRSGRVQFHPGDAFPFKPPHPVDWLLCDVIAAPERSARLLLEWLRQAWCRHFVVTIKMKDEAGTEALGILKQELPFLADPFFILRLNSNKKETCAFGSIRSAG